jgi:hypothetical protein
MSRGGGSGKGGRKGFFFEKKKQKTFIRLSVEDLADAAALRPSAVVLSGFFTRCRFLFLTCK